MIIYVILCTVKRIIYMKEVDTRREALRILARIIARKHMSVCRNTNNNRILKYRPQEKNNEDIPDSGRDPEDRRRSR